ncbi:MAG: DUF3800 domain-containing protein [Limisphaerales bacterium]
MNLAIYIDDSGTHDEAGLQRQSEIATVAGYAGKEESWVKFRKDWGDLLHKYSIPRLHYTELCHASKAAESGKPTSQEGNLYRGWTKQECDKFLLECANVAAAGSKIPVAGDVNTRGYVEYVKAVPQDSIGPPYVNALSQFYQAALGQIRKQWPNVRGPITFWFDQNQDLQWQAAIHQVHRSFERVYEKALPRIGGFGFGNCRDSYYYGLQAADLLAGRLRQLTRREAGYDPKRGLITDLDRILFGKFFGRNQPVTIAELLTRHSWGE